MCKAALFASAILAAVTGCRDRVDRTDRAELEYTRPIEPPAPSPEVVEPETYNTGTEMPAPTMSADTPSTTQPVPEPEDTVDTTAGTGRTDTPTGPSMSGQGAQARPAPRRAAPTATPAEPQQIAPSMWGYGTRWNADPQPKTVIDPSRDGSEPAEQDTTTDRPASPFSETASGTGTTTNTGTNSENQGTGGTDDPTR